METLDQRRRRMISGRDDLDSERFQDHSRGMETALGQSSVALNGVSERPDPANAGEGLLRPTSLGGSGSPDTMERGMMPLVPSPFHSDRVKAEIQLQRSRPATLDQDAANMTANTDTAARVARVDTTGAPSEATARQGALEERPPSPCHPATGTSLSPQLDGASSEQERGRMTPALCDRPEEADLALAVVEDQEVKPEIGDQRELIPAAPSRLEEVLVQMMAENRSLRVRLEQLENPASFMLGGSEMASREALERSPVSFAPDRNPAATAVHMSGSAMPESLLSGEVMRYDGFREVGMASMTMPAHVGTGHGPSLRDTPRGIPPPPTPPGGSLSFATAFARGMVPPPSLRLRDGSGSEAVRPREGVGGLGSRGVSEVPQGLASRLEAAVVEGAVARYLEGSQWASGRIGGTWGAAGQGSQSASIDPGFQTPRSSVLNRQFDKDGYPVSPGGTVIRPPPGPPPDSPRPIVGESGNLGMSRGVTQWDRPEEPAKYIHELPKLPPADLSTSAVACGNWVAQVRQIFFGLSPSAVVWWSSVEKSAGQQYQRWLTADPVDRLLLDPATVRADFDLSKFQRVESRAVSLVLAAVPQSVRDEAVSNRWLTTAALLFRVYCLYQPGGSSERAMLLSHLVSPENVKSYGLGVAMLRKWQQNFHRVCELQAALPDSSLLLKGVDGATAQILAQNPLIGFRVNAFRNRVSLDYNPSVATVLQLVRLLQAEFEAAALTLESTPPEKKARAAAAQVNEQALVGKGIPPRPPPNTGGETQVKANEGRVKGDGKGKGKEKGVEAGRDVGLCHHFADGKGCKYGDSCKFKHDRALARKQRRCLACGQEGHYRPDCTMVAAENRVILDSTGTLDPRASPPKRLGASKAKAAPQAKGITEDSGSISSTETTAVAKPGGSAQEALIAEAAKLLKGVSLKPISMSVPDPWEMEALKHPCPSELGIDEGWLRSAIVSAADQLFALVDSGATNALRPAKEGELREAKVIQVDLASGGTELHINRCGTLLSASPCQVIVPAGYLVQLGFGLSWKKKGCVIRRKGEAPLPVTVVKGCPLIPRELGLRLLDEYECLRNTGQISAATKKVDPLPQEFSKRDARSWLAKRVSQGRLGRISFGG